MTNEEVLIVDDDEEFSSTLMRGLRTTDVDASFLTASTPEKASVVFAQRRPSVVILDLNLNEKQGVQAGFDLLRKFLVMSPASRIIVLTGHGSIEYGIRAISLGAAHFIEKPARIDHLSVLIQDGFAQAALRREVENLRNKSEEAGISGFVGTSPQIRRVLERIQYASRTSQPVFITGETGTGKGVCARAIHRLSRRSSGSFIRYSPTFLTPDLVNSELFGHLRGSFTGASDSRKGLVAEADGGTLFLDEIDELPGETQVSILGLVQDRTYRPVGSNLEQHSDFRLIAASNQPIVESLENGKLRKDLFHRIAHLQIHIPPLRERKEDIRPLALHILNSLIEREEMRVHEIESAVFPVLSAWDWPGNIRELEAAIESAAFHASFRGRGIITCEDMTITPPASPNPETFHEKVEDFKLRLIREALVRNHGNQLKAAADLGMDRSSLRRILHRNPSAVRPS